MMRRTPYKTILVLIIAVLLLHHSSALADGDLVNRENDFQYWSNVGISVEVVEDWSLIVEEEFRFGDNAGEFYREHSDFGIMYSGLAKWLDIGANYRVIIKKTGDQWAYEYRPHINGILHFELHDFRISDRNRWEYRYREVGKDGWRYRNKLTIELPRFTRIELRPFVADEIYIDFEKGGFARNRLFSGLLLQPSKHLELETFYLLQTNKDQARWVNIHVLGTRITFLF
jgi:hypothetical protein